MRQRYPKTRRNQFHCTHICAVYFVFDNLSCTEENIHDVNFMLRWKHPHARVVTSFLWPGNRSAIFLTVFKQWYCLLSLSSGIVYCLKAVFLKPALTVLRRESLSIPLLLSILFFLIYLHYQTEVCIANFCWFGVGTMRAMWDCWNGVSTCLPVTCHPNMAVLLALLVNGQQVKS